MKKIIILASLIAVLPLQANAEMKMQNGNPSPEPAVEPTLGHHMQNRDPSPEQKAEPAAAPEHVMKNSNPKKWVSTNALSLEEKHTGK